MMIELQSNVSIENNENNKGKKKKKMINQSAAAALAESNAFTIQNVEEDNNIAERKIACDNYYSGLVAIMTEVFDNLSFIYNLLNKIEGNCDKHNIVYLHEQLLEAKQILISRSQIKNPNGSDNFFCQGLTLFDKYWQRHHSFLKACSIFYPRFIQANDWKNVLFSQFCKMCPVAKSFPEQSIKADYNKYINCATHPSASEQNFNLSNYWENNKTYPHLKKLALIVINMPCVSVAAERSFSLYRMIFGDKQHTILEDNLIASHSLQFNLPVIENYCKMMNIPSPFF